MAYIERKYLTEQFEDLLHDDNIMTPVVKVLDALKIIDTAPTADVVEVVRCKDCINSRPLCNTEKQLYCENCVGCTYLSTSYCSVIMFEDDYCSKGERKEVAK